MPSATCHLPNGQTFTVTPVFGGFTFKCNEMNIHQSAFPPGWTIVIHTEKVLDEDSEQLETPDLLEHNSDQNPHPQSHNLPTNPEGGARGKKVKTCRFRGATLRNDSIFISSISSPSSSDFKPPSSPTRQIAMMLWATLLWYFHEPEPNPPLKTGTSSGMPEAGRPKGDWRVNIKRDGIFKARNLLEKLERMGLITSEDSSVGLDHIESRSPGVGEHMFCSRRSFWQIDPRIFLFTLSPVNSTHSPSQPLSPYSSRPSTPSKEIISPTRALDGNPLPSPNEALSHNAFAGPFTSASHLPTYFPPVPPHYTFTDGIRHPIRQKAPHQGETFYTRYIPSVGQYLSFRVPFLDSRQLPGQGHYYTNPTTHTSCLSVFTPSSQASVPSDLDFLHKWMNDSRVNASWGEAGPRSHQEKFLRAGLTNRHSFPVIGCWDGKPFGYFEIYWVKEDRLGRLLAGNVDNYDRGLHVLVGEQEFRGPHRVPIWLSALVHYCWLADLRTQTVVLEPRVDNEKLLTYLQKVGFYKEGEVSFPHKQSAVMKIKRDYWEVPAL